MRFARIVFVLLCGILTIVCVCGCGRRGGTTLTLQADTASAAWPSSTQQRRSVMEQSKEVIAERLVSAVPNQDCEARIKGEDKIVVVLPSGTDTKAVIAAILPTTSKGTLELYHLKNVRSRNNPLGKWEIRPERTNQGAESYIFTGPNGETIDGSKHPEEVLSKVVNAKANPPVLSEKDIVPNAGADITPRQSVVVRIEFNEQGTEKFRDFTRENVNEYLAVFYNGRLLTAPTINEPIPNGKAEITGFKSLQEARDAADAINSGALPVKFKVVPN